MSESHLAPPKPAPPLNIPSSSSTVTVRVIDSTSWIGLEASFMLDPNYKGFSKIKVPSYSFLISTDDNDNRERPQRHVLFDLGVRKDWQNYAPSVAYRIRKVTQSLDVTKNVAEILNEDDSGLGVRSKDIDAVIWSHIHFDHIGHPGLFPPSTDLVVGPGFKDAFGPGYPTKERAKYLDSDVQGRNFREVDIQNEGKGLKIGQLDAMDFFGDGSLYLLSSPGHSAGHLCALARVTSNPDSFVLMGGDAVHHGGEARPSQYNPLPTSIKPSPLPKRYPDACPGEVLQKINPEKSATHPFLWARAGFNDDEKEAERTVEKLIELDAAENIFMIIAHDTALYDQLDYFPKSINDWYAKHLDAKTRWKFAEDFEEEVKDAAQL